MLLLRLLVSVVVAVLTLAVTPQPVSAASDGPRVLVFTKVSDPEQAHRSTPEAVNLLQMNARRYDYTIEATADASTFTSAGLKRYDVVMFLNTYGDVLDERQQTAFETWIGRGGGFMGIHSAARTEPGWDYFGELLGARAVDGEGTPSIEHDVVLDTERPAAANAPGDLNDHNDQWYTFDRDPAELKKMQILGTAELDSEDEGSPVVWARPYAGGRSWYTSLGHPAKAYEDGNFTKLLRSGIWWTADRDERPLVDASDAAPSWQYGLSFLAWIAAVAIGGALAVVKLNRREALP